MASLRGASLDGALDEQTRHFLMNPGKGLRMVGDIAQVSQIFDWFREDFGGLPGVSSFIRKHVGLPDFARIKPDISYNWRLNAV